MVKQVNILEARNSLSRLVAGVGNGEEVVIANRGKPVARLTRVDDSATEHTGRRAAEWLSANVAPSHAQRAATQLDRQIAAEREGWE